MELREDDGDDIVEILDEKLLLDFELKEDDCDEHETNEEEDVDCDCDGDELDTKDEDDVDDELLVEITEEVELDSFELLLCELLRDDIGELVLLLISEDVMEDDSDE